MASGETLFQWTPDKKTMAIFNGSNNAGIEGTATNILRLCYDDTTPEYVYFAGIMPQNYSGGGVNIDIYWGAAANTGDVDWDVIFLRYGTTGDIDDNPFGATTSADNNTVPGTVGYIQKTTIAVSNGTNLANITTGEFFNMYLRRGAPDDTLSGDAYIYLVVMREQ